MTRYRTVGDVAVPLRDFRCSSGFMCTERSVPLRIVTHYSNSFSQLLFFFLSKSSTQAKPVPYGAYAKSGEKRYVLMEVLSRKMQRWEAWNSLGGLSRSHWHPWCDFPQPQGQRIRGFLRCGYRSFKYWHSVRWHDGMQQKVLP